MQLIVVDNTNTMAWEMKPYITLAVNNGYKVHIMVINSVVYIMDISRLTMALGPTSYSTMVPRCTSWSPILPGSSRPSN